MKANERNEAAAGGVPGGIFKVHRVEVCLYEGLFQQGEGGGRWDRGFSHYGKESEAHGPICR